MLDNLDPASNFLDLKICDPAMGRQGAAQASAEAGSRVARDCGDYPLLSGGDTNLYSLFVERAQTMIHPRGLVGLLCPSGIAADKGASEFFRTLTTPHPHPNPPLEGEGTKLLPLQGEGWDGGGVKAGGSRLIALYDLENRKGLFPDVGSRFKFCALIFGGEQRAASVVVNADNLHRPAQQEANTSAQHAGANFYPSPQFWVSASEVQPQFTGKWAIAYKSITAPTNMRTMIAAIVPECGVGNSMAMLLPESEEQNYAQFAPLLLANLSSFALDFVLRTKVQGQKS